MHKTLRQLTIPVIGMGFLMTAGCYSRTVKETTAAPPTVVTVPNASQSSTTTTTTNPDTGQVERQTTTTYSNP